MILWTVQDIAVWELLEETGCYTTPAEHWVFPWEKRSFQATFLDAQARARGFSGEVHRSAIPT